LSTYYDKKKLINDNSDLYISEFDKALPAEDLGSIIEAKKDYKKASQEGNFYAMKAANDKANSIRERSGGYLGGADGSQRIAVSKPYEIRINQKYASPYEKEKNRVLNLISEKEEFSYNPYEDPIFAIYKNLYTKLGDDAYDRALADGALRMGGVASTSAHSAAMQAKNRYNTMLTNKIPELYESAYKKYQSEYERLYDELGLYTKLDENAYQRHRDFVSDWEDDRDYYHKKDDDAYSNYMDLYEADSNLEYKIRKDETDQLYKEERDAVKDAMWRQEQDYKEARDRKEDEDAQREYEYDRNSDTIKYAIDIAKILYGKTGASPERVKSIINMLSH